MFQLMIVINRNLFGEQYLKEHPGEKPTKQEIRRIYDALTEDEQTVSLGFYMSHSLVIPISIFVNTGLGPAARHTSKARGCQVGLLVHFYVASTKF